MNFYCDSLRAILAFSNNASCWAFNSSSGIPRSSNLLAPFGFSYKDVKRHIGLFSNLHTARSVLCCS